MKTLVLLALWGLAVVLAGLVVWRLLRRKPVVLRGRWSPRLVQMVAVLVLAVTDGRAADRVFAEDDAPEAKAGQADVEAPLSEEAVRQWRQRFAPTGSAAARFKQMFARLESRGTKQSADVVGDVAGDVAGGVRKAAGALPRPLRNLVRADIDALASGAALPTHDADTLIAVLDAMERSGCVDNWFLGYLWRITGRAAAARDRRADVKLYARLGRHVRMADALVRARAGVAVTRYNPRAWMSKAGPSKAVRAAERRNVERMATAFNKAWPEIGTTTWEMDAFAEFGLTAGSGSPTLIRRGERTRPKPGDALFRVGRLDLLETPAAGEPVTLKHVWLGEITLPRDRVISVWELPALLEGDAKARVASAVADALGGDTSAALRLEAALPLVHAELARQLQAAPKAKGAARLRTLMTLFDERVAPGP